MSKSIARMFASLVLFLLLAIGLGTGAFAQQPTPVFTPGNLIVAVAGCGVYGGTPPNTTPSQATCATPPVGGNGSATGTGPNSYGDDQASPWTLWQYSVNNGATSATFVNPPIPLPQLASGANFPVSDDYGSQSEGTLQLSGDGRFLTIMGYGLNAATFNVNYLDYCPGNLGTLASSCVPENGNPAMAQTGTLTNPTYPYAGNIPVPRVVALIDPYGNVNSSTVLYNIFNQNDARSAYTPDGTTIYVSGQGCKDWDSNDDLCDNASTLYDDTQGVYLTTVGATNLNPTPITGPDTGGPTTTFTGGITSGSKTVTAPLGTFSSSDVGVPISGTGIAGSAYVATVAVGGASATMSANATATNASESITLGCTLSTCDEGQSTRMVQIYNNTLYVSADDKGGYNRSLVGTLGTPAATSLYTCTGDGGGCPSSDGPYGPSIMPGFGNTGGTGKYTINTAGGQNNSNGNNFNAGLAVNLSPQNFFFASPNVLYVADTGSPKNDSNGPDAVCTTDGGSSKATVGDGGLQKWILNPTVTATVASGSTAVTSATSGAFTQGEVGLPISGTGIPAGATITAVSSAGKTATISTAATGNGTSVTVSGWSLAYTLYNGLNLVLNADCDPSSPTAPGTLASTGLYGVTGVVNNGVATLYVTNYPNNDLVQTYLYGITDTLTTMTMVTPGTAFTVLDTAPAGSVFRGVSLAPHTLPNGSETITSTPSGLTFATSGTGCAAGTYITPTTLSWTQGSSCTLSAATTQTVGNTPTNPATTTYNFVSWQDGTTNPASDTVAAPSTTGVYNIAFQTVPTVIFPTANAITYGEKLSSAYPLNGGSAYVGINGTTVSGAFTFTSPNFVPNAGTPSESVTFTPTDTTDYASVTGSISVTVNQATPTISISNLPASGVYGGSFTPAYSYSGTGTSTYSVVSNSTNICTVSGSLVSYVGIGTCSLTPSATETTDDTAVTGTAQTFMVGQATATVGLSNLTQTYTGSPLTPTATTIPSGLNVIWIGAPDTAVGNYAVTATVNNPNYTGSASGTFVINSAPPPSVVLTATATLTGTHSAGYRAAVTVANTGTSTATNVQLTSATLGSASGTPLTLSSNSIPAGGYVTATVTFPGSAGADEATVVEKYAGSYTGGSFTTSVRAVLP